MTLSKQRTPSKVRRSIKLHKLLFVLPNLFTLTSIFFGFYALTLCLGEVTPARLHQAAIAILFAAFCDGIDGRVARLTRTQSLFGVELDSLADVISFGVAPALVMYQWALAPWGMGGLFLAFAFAACGALRLARFNVLAQQSNQGGGSNYFVGLPIPLAAGMLVACVLALRGEPVQESARLIWGLLMGALALLMVSTVRYRTFKKMRWSQGTVLSVLVLLGVSVWASVQFHLTYVLVGGFALYLVAGLVETLVLSIRRRAARERAVEVTTRATVSEEE